MTTTMTTRPELSGHVGMVASTHWLASAAGMSALERGGNAFDAAVVTAFVLHVAEPHMNGPGGDASILFWRSDIGRPQVLCGQGPAPRAASIERFRELGLSEIPGAGQLAACVPGAVDAWLLMLRDHGTMALADILSYAIEYAETGVPALPAIVETIASAEPLIRQWPGSAELWLPDGHVPQAGSRLRNPALARTWRRLIDEAQAASTDRTVQIQAARDAFLRGFAGEAMVAHATRAYADSTPEPHAGLLAEADLAGFSTTYEEPVTTEFAGRTIAKTGLWGQGPVLAQQLDLLGGFDLRGYGRDSADFVHVVTECAKLAFADREAWYGDPAFTGIDVRDLLDADRTDRRRELVAMDRASLDMRPGDLRGQPPRLPVFDVDGSASTIAGLGEPTRGDTCHIDVVDRWGNMVSATPSGGWLQSSPAIAELGFALGSRAQMLWLTEGLPNSLAPGKRPRTTLTPTLVLDGDEAVMACGTPGGDQQDQWSLVFLLSHLVFGLDLQAAIDAPMFHTNHFPSSFDPHESVPGEIEIEPRFAAGVIPELESRGHRVQVVDPWSLGRLSAVTRDRDGVLRGAANPRGMQGYAVGR